MCDILISGIITQPNNIGVLALENIVLKCTASINDVRYLWHRVDGRLLSHMRGRRSNTLIIHKATPHDGGLYYCTAKKRGIVVSSNNASVRVYGKNL